MFRAHPGARIWFVRGCFGGRIYYILCLAAGVDVNEVCSTADGVTALMLACSSTNAVVADHVVAKLLAAGADPE